MALFGKSDEDLKKLQGELQQKQHDLNGWDNRLKTDQSKYEHEKTLLEEARAQFEAEREAFREEANAFHASNATDRAELEKRRIDLSKLEAAAKAKFVEKQREAFKEVIESRMAELDARQQELDSAEDQLATRYKDLHTEQAEVANRELAVTEREQKADAGFADKAKALAEETARHHQANQAEAERLRAQADALAADRQQYELKKAELVKREQAIIAAEQKRDAGFADERAALDTELLEKRQKTESEISAYRAGQLATIEADLGNLRTMRLTELATAENIERDRIRAEIAAERAAWEKHHEAERKQLEASRSEVEKKHGAVSARQSELEGRRDELETNERTLEVKESRLERQWQKRNDEMGDLIADRLEEERQWMATEKQELKNQIALLREGISSLRKEAGAYEQYEREFEGRHPADVIRDLHSQKDAIAELKEKLATRPTEEMREKTQEMESEIERQKARIEELVSQVSDNAEMVDEASELRRKNHELDADNKMLSQKADRLEGAANEAQAELKRLRAAYESSAEVEDRYKEIEMPHIKSDKVQPPKNEETIDENTWLTGVRNACKGYGFNFNPRILHAFHTALKTAEWSPLTILAGVSGTGKSELPRLYSHFGGLMYEPLSVQPNWDSQESMLGFFNSIDNKFDAQPVLRFLAQSQKKWIKDTDDNEGYPGLQDAVCLILLDEMNLAHPELYFAEFLSKLELRRGMKGTDVPFLPVKIGAGMPAYQLPLGRNVLWTGTMNQDETTKSLSDKVLDRSIIIHFPRPTELKRRLKLSPLDEKNRGPLLHKAIWQSWLAQGSSFSDEDIKPFKTFLEEMNDSLGVVGRALGHRVWQSVEYYMANYPDVRDAQRKEDRAALVVALHTAFEDQLVQKVMPKLRGIDTTGDSRSKCLDQIRAQLNIGIKGVREIDGKAFSLNEDFDLACTLGHGQFIWQSANYLKDEKDKDMPNNSSSVAEEVEQAESISFKDKRSGQ